MSTTAIPLKSEHLPPHLLSPSQTDNEKMQSGITPPDIAPNATITNTNTAAQTPMPTASATTPLLTYLSTLPEFHSIPRMQSLYADLGRQKASNPSGFAANLGWWRGVLGEIVRRDLQPSGRDANSLVLRVDQELSDALRVERIGRPAGLGTVVVRMPLFI
jgi:hypothetical protein